jgi:hypothetical protein
MNVPTAPLTCRSLIVGLLLVAPWASTGAAAGDGAPTATTAVVVEVDAMDEDLGNFGTSSAGLGELLTRQLQSAGVKVIAGADLGQEGAALLRLRVRLMRSGYVELYGINLSLHNKVRLEGGAAYTTIETWSDGGTGSIAQSDVDVIENVAAELVDRFLATRSGN